jgi:hypothetical protein
MITTLALDALWGGTESGSKVTEYQKGSGIGGNQLLLDGI